MLLVSGIRIPYSADESEIMKKTAHIISCSVNDINGLQIIKQSLDARKKNDICFLLNAVVTLEKNAERKALKSGNPSVSAYQMPHPYTVEKGTKTLRGRIVIAGFGPAGIFAAWLLAKNGYKPLVIERGEKMEDRVRHVEELWSKGVFREESNPMFGEGGAGTFSDGKLTSRSKDPRGSEVLRILAENGAPEQIRYLAKPHIGTDRLRLVIQSIRNEIIKMGGEILFSAKLEEIKSENGALTSVLIQSGDKTVQVDTEACILATGLGARDTIRMLMRNGVALAPKPFAAGLRIEHPQGMINLAQFGSESVAKAIGAAEYRLTAEAYGRGVYTFCMCPGGTVVTTPSEQDQMAVNGMSNYARDGANANAAVVVQIFPEDFHNTASGGMEYCETLERNAFLAGGGEYLAPACRVDDFIHHRKGTAFGSVIPSCRPGVEKANLYQLLPTEISSRLEKGIISFGTQLKGFDMGDAVLTGAETRTSSPVRIVRDENMESVSLKGLYPVGEGAGYAGGIISAAIDGLKAAERVTHTFSPSSD